MVNLDVPQAPRTSRGPVEWQWKSVPEYVGEGCVVLQRWTTAQVRGERQKRKTALSMIKKNLCDYTRFRRGEAGRAGPDEGFREKRGAAQQGWRITKRAGNL